MARYIDADALIERILKLKVVTDDMYGMGIARGIERAETAIQMQPTADVAPRAEVDELKRENESLAKTVNEASELIRKQRTKIEKVKAEVAREIFEEIERETKNHGIAYTQRKIAELKKKYTED